MNVLQQVANQSSSYKYFNVENHNEFTIMIRLISLSLKTIRFPEGDHMIIKSGSSLRRLIEFRAHNIGEFNSYFDYMINNNHSYEILLTANVVCKQLNLHRTEIDLRKEWFHEERYQPLGTIIKISNKLNARTNYQYVNYIDEIFKLIIGNFQLGNTFDECFQSITNVGLG